jgi:hypothetical protein
MLGGISEDPSQDFPTSFLLLKKLEIKSHIELW